MIDLSIVIVSYHCRELLLQTVESIYQVTKSWPVQPEVIVVENGQDGGGRAVKERFKEVQLVEDGENRGFAGGNNVGAKLATGRYVLLLNPDTICLPETFQPMMEFMDTHPRCGICGPRVLNEQRCHTTNPQYASTPASMLKDTFWHRLAGRPQKQNKPTEPCLSDFAHGSCMMIRRELYQQLGGLDERLFMYCEEYEFSCRALREGWETWFVPAGAVIHLGEGASSGYLPRVMPLRLHSAMVVFGRQRGWCWMLAFRFASLCNLLVDVLTALVRIFRRRGKDKPLDRLNGIFRTLLVAVLPLKVGSSLIYRRTSK